MNHSSLPSDTNFERFCLVLSSVPEGRVCSYGQLAKLAELSGPRHTCRLLKKLPTDSRLPWHRIVNAQGKLADFSHASRQYQLLQAEGVVFSQSGRIPQNLFWAP